MIQKKQYNINKQTTKNNGKTSISKQNIVRNEMSKIDSRLEKLVL